MAAPGASRELFTDGVRAVLDTWPVLQIAVDNGFGGVFSQQKADWMVDVVQNYFHDNADLQQCEVEDFVAQLMDQEFDTVVDDGSLPQVSHCLCQMFSLWQQGALQQLRQKVAELTKKTERAKVKASTAASDDSDADTEAMDCDDASGPSVQKQAPPPPTQDEEDGWTVVRKKK